MLLTQDLLANVKKKLFQVEEFARVMVKKKNSEEVLLVRISKIGLELKIERDVRRACVQIGGKLWCS